MQNRDSASLAVPVSIQQSLISSLQSPLTNYSPLLTDHFSLPFAFLVNNFHIAHKINAGGNTIGRITTTSQMRKFAIP